LVCTGTAANPGTISIAQQPDLFTRSIVKGRIIRHNQPFYNLPDVGHLEGSTLILAGRSDEVYNFSGSIHAYGAITDEIAHLIELRDVAIVSGASIGNDRDLVIGIVADRPFDPDDLARRLSARLHLAEARKHFKVFQTDRIRRNPQSGKIDRVGHLQDFQSRNRELAPAEA
jgi:hypothetical protein